jgi:hypothetical protein
MARPERLELPTFWFEARGPILLELAGTEPNETKISKLQQIGASYLPFPFSPFFRNLRQFATTCMTFL